MVVLQMPSMFTFADIFRAQLITSNLTKSKMKIFGCCLLLLSFVRVYLQSLSGIKTQTFNKKNCQNGSTSILPGYTTVKCRSSLGCAFECSKRTCKSYKYDRTSSECRLSYGGLDIENDDWFCAPFNQGMFFLKRRWMPFCLQILLQQYFGYKLLNFSSLFKVTNYFLN